jgi:hypothetical protein
VVSRTFPTQNRVSAWVRSPQLVSFDVFLLDETTPGPFVFMFQLCFP